MSYMKASLMERSFEVGIHQTAAAIALADRVIGERNELLRTLREIASLPDGREHLAPGLAYIAIERFEGEMA
ncbi:MAG: hypothetical protein QG672_270 [Pseudomonadota bacterium]|nr:hypothetical protein [Pseudomonadota bacterium]